MLGPKFLTGEAVSLRPIEDEDVGFLRDNVNDPAIWRAMERATPASGAEQRETVAELREDDTTVPFLVTTRQSRVGFVSLTELNDNWGNAALSFWIAPDQQGEGYGADAVSLAVEYAFEHRRLHKLIAHTIAVNDASIGLLESLGFEREGRHRDEAFVDGEYHDLLAFGVLEEEWREDRSAAADS